MAARVKVGFCHHCAVDRPSVWSQRHPGSFLLNRAGRPSYSNLQSSKPFSPLLLLPRSKPGRRNKTPQVAEPCHHLPGRTLDLSVDRKSLDQNRSLLAIRKILMKSVFAGEDTNELFPNHQAPSTSASAESAGTCSDPECSAFSPTLRGEVAFPFPPIGMGLLFICLLLRRAGRSTVPLGVPHPAAKVSKEKAFLSEIPISNHFFPPLGSGQREARPDHPPCAGSPGAEGAGTGGRRRELSWINSRSEARGALGPLGNHVRAGERPSPTQDTPALWDLCLQPHRGCVGPLE